MIRVWLPWPQVAEGLGPVGGVAYDLYDGTGPLPDSWRDVEIYVPPFLAAGRAVEVIGELPRLRLVQLLTAGADTVIPHVPPHVTLCTAKGAHDASTSEWAVAALLADRRELPRFVRSQLAQQWDFCFTGTLAGCTVLVVGYGSIGTALERRLAPFEVEVLRVARRPRDGVAGLAQLPELLPLADAVVLLVPLTDETRGMVDAAFLIRMRDGALLVNAARGPVVDTDALLAELTTGRLRAVLDVTDPEPLPAGHPLWSAPGLLVTPHVGGSTRLSSRRVYEVVRRQLERYVAGEPLLGVVDGAY